jgi:hypothetical protein
MDFRPHSSTHGFIMRQHDGSGYSWSGIRTTATGEMQLRADGGNYNQLVVKDNGNIYMGGTLVVNNNLEVMTGSLEMHGRPVNHVGGLLMDGGINMDGNNIFGVNWISSSQFLYTSSDKQLKENVRPVENALDKVLLLDGVEFNWKESGENSLGVIAQDLEKIFPELVYIDPETGLRSVQYSGIIAPLIEAIKAQQEQISEQEKQNQEQQKQIDELWRAINRLR